MQLRDVCRLIYNTIKATVASLLDDIMESWLCDWSDSSFRESRRVIVDRVSAQAQLILNIMEHDLQLAAQIMNRINFYNVTYIVGRPGTPLMRMRNMELIRWGVAGRLIAGDPRINDPCAVFEYPAYCVNESASYTNHQLLTFQSSLQGCSMRSGRRSFDCRQCLSFQYVSSFYH